MARVSKRVCVLMRHARGVVRRYHGIKNTPNDKAICAAIGIPVTGKQQVRDALLKESERIKEECGVRSIPRWASIRKAVFKRDNNVCGYCRIPVAKEPHCDHIYPYVLGGSSEMENLVTACQTCNISKGRKILSPNKLKAIQAFIGIA